MGFFLLATLFLFVNGQNWWESDGPAYRFKAQQTNDAFLSILQSGSVTWNTGVFCPPNTFASKFAIKATQGVVLSSIRFFCSSREGTYDPTEVVLNKDVSQFYDVDATQECPSKLINFND